MRDGIRALSARDGRPAETVRRTKKGAGAIHCAVLLGGGPHTAPGEPRTPIGGRTRAGVSR